MQSFWQQLDAAHELYSSIRQALQEKEGEAAEREFPEHRPAQVLEAGIKSGHYMEVEHVLGRG